MISLGEALLIIVGLAGLIELGLWVIEKVSDIPAIKRRVMVDYDDNEEDW